MSNPSPMHKSKASRDYERLMRREIPASQYTQTLRQEAREDAQRALKRRRNRTEAD